MEKKIRVKMRDSIPWYTAGRTYDVPEAYGLDLVARGMASLVEETPVKKTAQVKRKEGYELR